MEKSTLYERLNAVQKELKSPKSQFNKFGNFNYRSCEDILEAVKPILHKYGLALWIDDDIVNIGDRFYVKATAHLSVIDGTQTLKTSAFARESLEKKGMDSAQLTGATNSYCHKYLLGNLFLVDDTKDHDSDVHQPEEPAKKVTPFTKKTTPKPETFEPSPELDEYIGKVKKVVKFKNEEGFNEFKIYTEDGYIFLTNQQDEALKAKKAKELNCDIMVFHKDGIINILETSADEKVEQTAEMFDGKVVQDA